MLLNTTSNTDGEILHIGDMRFETSIEELVTYIGHLLNYDGTFTYVNAPEGSVSRRCPDTNLASKLFNYKPKVDWKMGVKDTVEWYKNYIEAGGEIFE